ncbi:hypothetical protein [Bdellovibrio bacteriovorus]|uniref:hypothetical protein n=1 Tax=Bdellovibrio bacteriovorus TaxID=959 RepID=UPI0035A58A8C
MMRPFLVFSTLLIMMISFADASMIREWKEVGNGGNVLQCSRTNIWMFDAFEAQYHYRLKPSIPAQSIFATNDLDALSLAELLLLRLQPRDFNRWQTYQNHLGRFAQEAEFLEHVTLAPIDDTGYTGYRALPLNCQIKQLIVQRRTLQNGKRYVINRRLWSRLPLDQQAVAILHEVIYRAALEANPELNTSASVRYMNALIISNGIQDISEFAYKELTSSLR